MSKQQSATSQIRSILRSHNLHVENYLYTNKYVKNKCRTVKISTVVPQHVVHQILSTVPNVTVKYRKCNPIYVFSPSYTSTIFRVPM